MDFFGARDYILGKLRNELDPKLTYHNLSHTLDVHDAVVRIARLENISQEQLGLLEMAAYYHDSGMLIRYAEHEKTSVSIIREVLPGFGYSPEEIEEIGRLILVTILPQKANDHLEKIICDADLDSLGREDFFIQSFCLQLEWKHVGIKDTSLADWFHFELEFLGNHKYFTASARALRDEVKKKNTEQIKDLLKTIHNQ